MSLLGLNIIPQAFYVPYSILGPWGFYRPPQLVQDAQRHQIQDIAGGINASDYGA